MDKRFVVFLNGPPESGKDFIGEKLAEITNEYGVSSRVLMFKDVLYNLTADYFDMDRTRLKSLATDRGTKEVQLWELGGKSPRGALIHVSEEVYKPLHGKDYFGKCSVDSLSNGINYFTDSGFKEEMQPVVDEVGKENCILIRVHLNGRTFEGDSRSYVYLDGVTSIDFYNNVVNDELTQMSMEYLTDVIGSIFSKQMRNY